MYHELSNHDLVLQCQSGLHPEKLIFAELIYRHQTYVEKVIYHLAPDWFDRADLAQEVWIRVYHSIKHLRDPAKFRGWLSRIISNLFFDELRKRKRDNSLFYLNVPFGTESGEITWEIASADPSPTDHLMTQEFYEQLQEAIADLPESFRTTIVLREIQDMPYKEIAEMTGVSLGTVKSRVVRARRQLQAQLSAYLQDETASFHSPKQR
jgi:RNA polymerase sigma factor (sigma-70 family)